MLENTISMGFQKSGIINISPVILLHIFSLPSEVDSGEEKLIGEF